MRIAIFAAADYRGSPVGGTSSFLSGIIPQLSQRHTLALVGLGGLSWTQGHTGEPSRPDKSIRPAMWFSTRAASVRSAFTARAPLRSWSPEVTYAHSPELALLARHIAPRSPCVLHLHGVANPLVRSRFSWARTLGGPEAYELLYRFAARSCAMILVSSSDADRLALCERFAIPVARSRLIPTALDPRIFRPRADLGNVAGDAPCAPQFVAACRLSRVKRLDLAIEALAFVKRTCPRANLVIAGDGEERSALERLARMRIPDGTVRFLGEVDRYEVARLLQSSVALLMPSESEGFPVAAIESLACGTPVVCSSIGGLADLVRDGINGYFAVPGSPTSFARALIRAAKEFPRLRSACVESSHQYSAERVGRLVEDALLQSSHGSSSQ